MPQWISATATATATTPAATAAPTLTTATAIGDGQVNWSANNKIKRKIGEVRTQYVPLSVPAYRKVRIKD